MPGLGRPRRLLLLQTSARGAGRLPLSTNSAPAQLCARPEMKMADRDLAPASVQEPRKPSVAPRPSSWGTSRSQKRTEENTAGSWTNPATAAAFLMVCRAAPTAAPTASR